MQLDCFVISDTMIFLRVPKGADSDKYMQFLAKEKPVVIAEVTVFKPDNYDNERQYNYELNAGKYRKKRYSKELPWKDSNGSKCN